MSDIMHVGIEEPTERRKEILNIAIDTIQALKEFEIHRKTLREKDVYRKKFVSVVKDLSTFIQEFKDLMPVAHVPHPAAETEKKEEAKPEETKPVIVKKPVVKKSKTHLDELEDDLARLREKISRL